MNLTIERDAALKAMQAVSAVAARKATIPILSCVLLRADDALTVTASGLDIEITTRAACRVMAPGSACIAADRFGDVLRNLPSGSDLTLTAEDNAVVVKSGRFRCRIPSLPPTDFPLLTPLAVSASVSLPAAQLALLLHDTTWTVKVEANRMQMAGVHFHAHDGRLRAVATQAMAIVYRDTAKPVKGVEALKPTTVPLRAAQVVAALIDDASDVRLDRMEGRVVFTIGETVVAAQLINLEFPDYTRPIPKAFTHDITVDVEGADGLFRRSMIMASEATQWVRITAAESKLLAVGRNQDAGQSSDEIEADIEAYEDALDPTCLLVGARVLDILSRIRTESVVIRFSGEKTPLLFLETGEPDGLFLMLPSMATGT